MNLTKLPEDIVNIIQSYKRDMERIQYNNVISHLEIKMFCWDLRLMDTISRWMTPQNHTIEHERKQKLYTFVDYIQNKPYTYLQHDQQFH